MKVGKFREIYRQTADRPKTMILPIAGMVCTKRAIILSNPSSEQDIATDPIKKSRRSSTSLTYDAFLNYKPKPKVLIKSSVQPTDTPLHPGDATDLMVEENVILNEDPSPKVNKLPETKNSEKSKIVNNNNKAINNRQERVQGKQPTQNNVRIQNENNKTEQGRKSSNNINVSDKNKKHTVTRKYASTSKETIQQCASNMCVTKLKKKTSVNKEDEIIKSKREEHNSTSNNHDNSKKTIEVKENPKVLKEIQLRQNEEEAVLHSENVSITLSSENISLFSQDNDQPTNEGVGQVVSICYALKKENDMKGLSEKSSNSSFIDIYTNELIKGEELLPELSGNALIGETADERKLECILNSSEFLSTIGKPSSKPTPMFREFMNKYECCE